MPLPVPEPQINVAYDFARNMILRANQAEETLKREYETIFQTLWGVCEPGNGSIHTRSFLQSAFDEFERATAIKLLQMGSQFIATWGNVLRKEYHQPAWSFEIQSGGRIVIGELLPVWRVVEQTPDPEAIS